MCVLLHHAQEENNRLLSEITQTKGAAMHQITELSNHVQALQDELERTKHTLTSALDAEKRAQNDVDRTKKEIELLTSSREELQQQLALETASLRRELQDSRLKAKGYSEARQALEVEMLNVRTQLQTTEVYIYRPCTLAPLPDALDDASLPAPALSLPRIGASASGRTGPGPRPLPRGRDQGQPALLRRRQRLASVPRRDPRRPQGS
jgi:hypothetical protein